MKKLFYFVFFICLCLKVYSVNGNSTQLIKAGHWVYNDLYTLSSEAKKSYFIDNQPLTVGELKFYFKEIEFETLSESGKFLYQKIDDFLNTNQSFFKDQEFRLFVNTKINAEFYYKSNPQIPFSFDYAIKDRFLTVPIIIGFADYVTLQTDLFLGKNYIRAQSPDSFSNIPLAGDQFEFLTPRYAYGSCGITRDDWGANISVAKEGLTVGNTLLGSVIYNNTFETDFYVQINFFTKWLKYTSDIVQVSSDKYIYLHQVNIRPFKNFKFGCIEGSLLNAPFELRFLNPLTIMHGFKGWVDYANATEMEYYNEGHFGAYLCFTMEYMPVSNLRIYAMYAQNEILDFGWAHSDIDYAYPDSLGGQLGIEHTIPLINSDFIKNTVEAVYTSPFLYVKQSPDWSFYKVRTDEFTHQDISSWIGSPFGPDCFAVKYNSTYQSKKWKTSLSYLFKIHGENNSSIFNTTQTRDGTDGTETKIYTYYPWTEYKIATEDGDTDAANAAIKKSRNMWMSGIREYTNQFTISGEYQIFDNLKLYGQVVYSFIFNTKNILNNFQQGIELGIGCEYSIF